jgi:hypothetical protein
MQVLLSILEPMLQRSKMAFNMMLAEQQQPKINLKEI